MALLLDTHVAIWLEEMPSNISAVIRQKIEAEPTLFLSVGSVWEMSIKMNTGKLTITKSLEDFVEEFLRDYSCTLLPASLPYLYFLRSMPLHHRDPFDRLLIAQAAVENISIVSIDTAFDAYGVKRVW